MGQRTVTQKTALANFSAPRPRQISPRAHPVNSLWLAALLGSIFSFVALPSLGQTVALSPTEIEYSHALGDDAFASVGLSYQGETSWAEILRADDEDGTEQGSGFTFPQDPLALSLTGGWDRRDDTRNPIQGSKLEFGVEQLIPLQRGDSASSRLRANYTQWVPVALPGVREGNQTLVLNVQGGSVLGDSATFELGGANSVRGYGEGKLGSGKQYVQATAEYRFPLLSAQALGINDIAGLSGFGLGKAGIGGSVFVDYANILGAEDQNGQGLGVGAGLNARTPLGLVRLELAVNDQRETKLGFRLGDRF